MECTCRVGPTNPNLIPNNISKAGPINHHNDVVSSLCISNSILVYHNGRHCLGHHHLSIFCQLFTGTVCLSIFSLLRDASLLCTTHFHITFPIHHIFQLQQSQSNYFASKNLPSRFWDQSHQNIGVFEEQNTHW